MILPNLSAEINELHADICSALADPSRILIIYALAERAHNVTDLATELNISQPTASRHLKVLRERSLVRANRQGPSVEYSLADDRLVKALDLLRLVMRDSITQRASLLE